MLRRCPLCGQNLPHAIKENEFEARIQKLASPAVKKQKAEFEVQMRAALEQAQKKAERRFQQERRAIEEHAKKMAQRDIDAQLRAAERRIKEIEERKSKRNTDRESKAKTTAARVGAFLVVLRSPSDRKQK